MNPHALMVEFPNSSSTVTVLVVAAVEKEIHENLFYSPSLSPIALRIPQLDPSLLQREAKKSVP